MDNKEFSDRLRAFMDDPQGCVKKAEDPSGWVVYLRSEETQRFYDSQEDIGYVEDLTNHPDAEVTPLFAHLAPTDLSGIPQGKSAPSDEELAALAIEHIATGYPKLREMCPEMADYKDSEQFARVKAFAHALLSRHGAQPAAQDYAVTVPEKKEIHQSMQPGYVTYATGWNSCRNAMIANQVSAQAAQPVIRNCLITEMSAQDEREAFEAWLKKHPYMDFSDYAWHAWQARARLADGAITDEVTKKANAHTPTTSSADAERLDSLEAFEGKNQWIVAKGIDSFTVYLKPRHHATRSTLLEAIDAAIAAMGKGGEQS